MRELHDTVGDRKAFVVNHKATWEIKLLKQLLTRCEPCKGITGGFQRARHQSDQRL
jgi:hypothetical protein